LVSIGAGYATKEKEHGEAFGILGKTTVCITAPVAIGTDRG